MAAMIGPRATVEKGVNLPDGAQLGQMPPLSVQNPEFMEPIYIGHRRQVLVVGPVGSRADMVTAIYGQGEAHDQVFVFTGCFGGTLATFEEAVITRKALGDPNRDQYASVIGLIRALEGARHRFVFTDG